MQKFTLRKKVCLLCLLFITTIAFTSRAQDPTWERVTPKYETAETFVAAFNVLDHGADPNGNTDQTQLFQGLLDKLGKRSNGAVYNAAGEKIGANANGNGGVLYVPEGKYLFEGRLTLPKGVTIRGDWEKPVKGQPVKGTIFMIRYGAGYDAEKNASNEVRSFITMQPSSAIRDINIWYPDQDPNKIIPYSPAILSGASGYWGNEYTLVSNITFVNAFDGVIFSRLNGGGAPNYYGIYGSPLRRGIEIDNLAEVGRIDNVDFSPDYWAGSGLPGSPSIQGNHKKYIAENGTAMTVRRIDWSFMCKIKAEGYHIGQRLDYSVNPDNNGNYPTPNGHNYGAEFTNCTYGVYAAAASGAGMMFYNYKFNDCDFGFYFPGAGGGMLQMLGCEFNTKKVAVYATSNNTTKILMNQCIINNGAVDIRGGLASVVASNFNNESEKSDHIILGSKAIVSVTGNKFANNEPRIKNLSSYECIIDHEPIIMEKLPEFPYKNQYDFVQKPSGNAYYLATANGVSTEADDNSEALQILLNKAKQEGGGLVFLPPGRYNFRQPLTIPMGVELKGSVDIPSVPTGPGTALQIYAGKDDESGTPFITMEPGSGIRGLVLNYPEQKVQLLSEPELNNGDVYHYPYAIRGNKDVYIVNIGLRACFHGIDLFTNKCDNHFVDYLAGHVFKTGIRVGGGSKGGHIYNCQFNQIAYGSGGETKFGAWPNSPDNDQVDKEKYTREHHHAYSYCWNHLDFLVLEDCEDQILYNNFDFGSNRGLTLTSRNGTGPSGLSLGQGIDAGMNAFYIKDVDDKKGFNFINTQIVTTAPDKDDKGYPYYVLQQYRDNNRYLQVDSEFTGKVTFFGADFWGQPQNISNEILNGTLELQTANFSNSGRINFSSVTKNGKFNIVGSNVNPMNTLLTEGSAPQFYIQSSLINKGNTNTDNCGLWLNNLEFAGKASTVPGDYMDRTGWIATASVYNENAQKTLDGDLNTRWSTMSENQKPGQWFKVDMLEDHIFTGILMEAGTNAPPAAIKVYASSDDINWKEVASGSDINELAFKSQTARYIKVEQTSSRTSSWRMSEFYVTDLPDYFSSEGDPSGIQIIPQKSNVRVYLSGNQLTLLGTTGISTVRIYNLSGQLATAPLFVENSVHVNLPKGIYIAAIENNGKIYTQKLLMK